MWQPAKINPPQKFRSLHFRHQKCTKVNFPVVCILFSGQITIFYDFRVDHNSFFKKINCLLFILYNVFCSVCLFVFNQRIFNISSIWRLTKVTSKVTPKTPKFLFFAKFCGLHCGLAKTNSEVVQICEQYLPISRLLWSLYILSQVIKN